MLDAEEHKLESRFWADSVTKIALLFSMNMEEALEKWKRNIGLNSTSFIGSANREHVEEVSKLISDFKKIMQEISEGRALVPGMDFVFNIKIDTTERKHDV